MKSISIILISACLALLKPSFAFAIDYVCTSKYYFNIMNSGNSRVDEEKIYLITLTTDKLIFEEPSALNNVVLKTDYIVLSRSKDFVVAIDVSKSDYPLFASLVLNTKELRLTRTVNSSHGASVINMSCSAR